MPKYIYFVKTKDGKTIRDVEEASSKEEIIARLKSKGLFIISINELVGSEKLKLKPFSSFYRRGKRYRVNLYDLAVFARNLSITLSSGITLLRSLEILSLQTESRQLEEVLKKCTQYVKEGLSLSEAISKYPNIFFSLWVGIVSVGESSGNLPVVMEKLADYLEIRMEFERKIKSALVYPVIVLVVAVVAAFVLFTVILPKFAVIFKQFTIELPLITRIMISSSEFVRKYILLLIATLGVGIYLLRYSFKNPLTKKFWDKVKLRFPIVGDIIFINFLERFCSSMAILLESGLPLVSTLEIVLQATGNSFLEKRLLYILEHVKSGAFLSREFEKQELFPPLVSEMIKIGEETGTLPEIFNRIANHYRKESSTRVERLISAFEPLMIILVGIIVGIIVISLFLPLFKISTLSGAKDLNL